LTILLFLLYFLQTFAFTASMAVIAYRILSKAKEEGSAHVHAAVSESVKVQAIDDHFTNPVLNGMHTILNGTNSTVFDAVVVHDRK
jgi:hypothetical protein